jgi:hypothetical protein
VADLKCNSCGVVVDTVPIGRASARLMELGSKEICSAPCPHCGATNVFRSFTVIEGSSARNAVRASASSGRCSDPGTPKHRGAASGS